MTALTINKETEEELQICREPSTKAWAILVGVTSLGIGAAYYCNDWFLWKLIYISGAVFVGLSCFEDWEECTFNKKEGQVKLKTETVFQKFLGSENNKTVTADLSDLVGVRVREEEVKYAGKGYMVVMQFEMGISLGIMETAVLGDKSELETIAQKIIAFTSLGQMSEDEEDFEDNTVSSSTGEMEVVDEEEVKDVSEVIGTESNMADAEASPTVPQVKEEIKSHQLVSPIPAESEDTVTSTTTTTTTQQDPESSSSDESFEKIEKPSSDEPLQ